MTVLLLVLSTFAEARSRPRAKAPPPPPRCDVESKAVDAAAPQGMAAAFNALAACDARMAKAAAPNAFPKMLAGKDADAAVVTALKIGVPDVARAWIDGLESDQRSAAISALGETCATPEVPAFFLAAAGSEDFYKNRWYKGLDDCRVPEVQALLKDRITASTSDRSLLFGLLETYSRNAGAAAIPLLEEMLVGQKDAEIATNLVSSFADAAGVGQPGGATQEASSKAVAAIVKAAPGLPAKALDQARITLGGLGAEAESDRIAGIRYKDALQEDGRLMYGVVIVERATCKKGDTRITVHHAPALMSPAWPNQVGDRVKDAVESLRLDLATKCKGTGTVSTVTSPTPMKDAEAYEEWISEQIKDIVRSDRSVKPKIEEEDTFDL